MIIKDVFFVNNPTTKLEIHKDYKKKENTLEEINMSLASFALCKI